MVLEWLRRLGKAPSPEQLARQRERTQKRVLDQLVEAGVSPRREGGGGGLLTEPVLVFRPSVGRSMQIFDQDAETIGFVNRVWHNDWWEELSEKDGTILALYRLGKLLGPDGNQLATIGRWPHWKGSHTIRPITAGATALGSLRVEFFKERASVLDASGREAARIKARNRSYVVDIEPSVDEPLRMIVAAAPIVWDGVRPDGSG